MKQEKDCLVNQAEVTGSLALSDIEKLKEVAIVKHISDEIALNGGLIYQKYKKMGLTLSTVNCLIMATTQLDNFKILARNTKHYPEKNPALQLLICA